MGNFVTSREISICGRVLGRCGVAKQVVQDYSPYEIARKLATGKFNPYDSFFKYDHNGNVISGRSADVMVTINDNIDDIIDYFEEQEY